MKTIKFLVVIALCSAIMSGCSEKSAEPPHLVAVPKNAAVVLSLNAKQIVEKAALNKPGEYQCYALLQQEFGAAAEGEMINNFLKDTRTSGLNLDHIFAYLAVDGVISEDVEPCFGIVFLIDDLTTFENFLKKNELYDEDSQTIFKTLNLQWNDKIAVISRKAADNGVDVLNNNESESVLANELFKSEYSDKNDACLFIDYDNFLTKFLENYPYYAGMSNPLAKFDVYKGLAMAITLNAEKGEFVATGKVLPAEKATEAFGKFYKTTFDNELHHYFPDKSLVVLKFAIAPLNIYNEYKKYLNDIAADYKYEIEKFKEEYDAKITSILSNFTGDFLGSLSDITPPDFALAAGIAEGREHEVTAWIKELGFVQTPGGYYSLNQSGLELYFATNSKAAYLTGSLTNITNFVDNSYYTANITSAKDFGKELESALYYFYVDLNINHYPQMVKSMLSMSYQGKMCMPLLEKLKSLNLQMTSLNSAEFKIKFTGNDYASKILLKEIDNLAAQFL